MELHALDENGKMYKGVDSFILIWKNLSSFGHFRYISFFLPYIFNC